MFLDTENFSGFLLAFLTIVAVTPQVRKPVWEFCQLQSMYIPIMHLELGK